MKIVLIGLFCLLFLDSYPQQNDSSFVLEEGCYVIGYEINSSTTNFWYIKKDSSFFAIYTDNNHQIKTVRMGKWQYLGDSMISLQYLPLRSTLLLKSMIEYKAETKGSPDSVYFYGSIKDPQCEYPGTCGFIFDNAKKEYARFRSTAGYGFKSVNTNSNGDFGFVIHKSLYFGSLGVLATSDYYPLTINTFPGNNYHTLIIKVPRKDSTNDIDISKFDERPEIYKYKPFKEKKVRKYIHGELGITFITKDKTILLEKLYEFRKKQPYLVGPIDELIEYLRK